MSRYPTLVTQMQKHLKVKSLFANRAVIASYSAAFGAIAVICFTRVPSVSSANAAAWASAIATTVAVVVALYVGLAPEKARREASSRRALAVTQWAEGAVGLQLVHVGNAIVQMREPILDSAGKVAVVQQLQVLNAGPVRALVDYFDVLDPALIHSAGRCVIDIERGIQIARNIAERPPENALDMDGVRDMFVHVYRSMADARDVFSKLVYGSAAQSNEPTEVTIARAQAAAGWASERLD